MTVIIANVVGRKMVAATTSAIATRLNVIVFLIFCSKFFSVPAKTSPPY